MATIQPPPNSVWPNGLQTDSEGYVNFYPLGTNKVDISTITWPEGTKVKSPFVYQNDKLVGFVDTKALEIDNNDTTIDINYTHFDVDLDSIMENTLTINTPENATTNVKYGAVDKVLTEKIEKVLGKGNCKVKFDKDTNKAIAAVSLDTTEAQLADVKTLLARVLPRNLVTEFDPFPVDFTKVEYLESTGSQYMLFDLKLAECGIDAQITPIKSQWSVNYPISWQTNYGGENGTSYRNFRWVPHLSSVYWWDAGSITAGINTYGVKTEVSANFKNNKKLKLTANGETYETVLGEVTLCPFETACWGKVIVWDNAGNMSLHYATSMRMHHIAMSEGSALKYDLLPALDSTGTPCMFDTVTRKAFYNFGTGDFLYPGAEQAVQTTDLDAMSYAKLTEHGVRRLYHVPKGCTMTKDEYAATNGFKELVEPPMPLEGYWTPEWRETETQLICDWVETEPPTEEVETFNNEN